MLFWLVLEQRTVTVRASAQMSSLWTWTLAMGDGVLTLLICTSHLF